jgi:hypothetical protein
MQQTGILRHQATCWRGLSPDYKTDGGYLVTVFKGHHCGDGQAGNYQARGCPPTRLAAADSISFKSACVRAPAASIFRINSSNRAARKCISRRSEPVSSPSVFTSMRHSLVHRALSTRPLTSVRRACCRRGVINPGKPFRRIRMYVTQNVRQRYVG